jgi:hypothetical protein
MQPATIIDQRPCERTLTAALIAHSAAGERAALLARAEARAAERMQELQFVDTRPAVFRSEAFVEDLAEPAGDARPRDMRGLAGVASRRGAGMMTLASVLSSWRT